MRISVRLTRAEREPALRIPLAVAEPVRDLRLRRCMYQAKKRETCNGT